MYDVDIRNELKKQLILDFQNTCSIIIDEFNVCWGDARIDIAVVNCSMHGYEIKSTVDTLERLPRQIEFYSKIFDFMTLVCSERWTEKAVNIIPAWWSLIEAREHRGKIKLEKYRDGTHNKNIDIRSILELTWKKEALSILVKNNMSKGMKSKSRRYMWDKILEIVEAEDIKDDVRECIKARNEWRPVNTLQRLYS